MIKLVLDSNCDLTSEFCQKHGIEMIPLSVAFGQKVYTENIDMSKKEFYEMMEISEELPKTSQPSPQQYFDVFEKLAKEGHQMIVLTVTSALSGCYQSAMIAKQMCENAEIEIIDTKSAAIGVQIQALEILKMIQKGEIFENILKKAKENVEKTRLYATIDTLKNLIKGGRVSKAEGLLGTLVDIKPMITFNEEGRIVSCAKSRGMKMALRKMAEHIRSEKIDFSKTIVCGYTAHADNLKRLIGLMSDVRYDAEVEVGAVIGTHAGPGAAAVAYFVE